MTTPAIGTTTAGTTAGDIVQSIRAQIPDPTSDPAVDGTAFTLATLLRWINDASRMIALSAPVIIDWYALRSSNGQSVYVLPSIWTSVEQAWFDNWPLWRAPELGGLFTSQITARSYYFGPHSQINPPRLWVWPACNRTGQTTTTTADIDNAAVTMTVASNTSFRPYGMVQIENEILWYNSLTGATTIGNLVRGQAGTVAVTHLSGATVTELNILMKAARLPTPLTGVADPFELPQPLWPLVELYALARCREAENENQVASQMRQEFVKLTEQLAAKAQLHGLRQGMQVSLGYGPVLYQGRVIIPAILAVLVPLLGCLSWF